MKILFDRKPANLINSEWASRQGIDIDRKVYRKSFPSKTSVPHHIPASSDVKLYYSEGSEFVVDAIKKYLGVEVFKKFIIGVGEAECSYSSVGYTEAGYMGLDTTGLNTPNSTQNLNVHPDIMVHAKVVATAQKGTRLAIGFPSVVNSGFKGDRHDINAVASYLISTMARLTDGDKIISEGHLVTLFVWSVNTWRGKNSNIKLYLAKMEKYTTYNVKKVCLNFMNEYSRDRQYSTFINKMKKNFF